MTLALAVPRKRSRSHSRHRDRSLSSEHRGHKRRQGQRRDRSHSRDHNHRRRPSSSHPDPREHVEESRMDGRKANTQREQQRLLLLLLNPRKCTLVQLHTTVQITLYYIILYPSTICSYCGYGVPSPRP